MIGIQKTVGGAAEQQSEGLFSISHEFFFNVHVCLSECGFVYVSAVSAKAGREFWS